MTERMRAHNSRLAKNAFSALYQVIVGRQFSVSKSDSSQSPENS